MPYEGEYAHYQPLKRIVESERVQQLLRRSRVLDSSTLAQQANNRSNNNRLEVDGHVMTLSEAATKYGVAASTIAARRHLGWPMAMALLLPVGKHTRHYS